MNMCPFYCYMQGGDWGGMLPCLCLFGAAAIAAPGDDGNYGSAATIDVLCLQALSKRIHYGKFVAEAKFR